MDDSNSTARMPTLEPYIDGRKLAGLMGISERTINRWVAEGMPSETWGAPGE